jgi:hypothetical protein
MPEIRTYRVVLLPRQEVAAVNLSLREAEAWVRVEGGDAGDVAVAQLREALARDMIGA